MENDPQKLNAHITIEGENQHPNIDETVAPFAQDTMRIEKALTKLEEIKGVKKSGEHLLPDLTGGKMVTIQEKPTAWKWLVRLQEKWREKAA